ncbi:MAG TPA: tryptophan-rich sensory protein [Ruminococcaceae bacterium]|nr:tryptophan-rich sensory protein [Oscillospiraceae bacterium]
MKKKWIPYLVFPAISLLVGSLSALLTGENMMLYQTVEKPALAPPAILFPIVWTVLYLLMGIGAAMVYNAQGDYRTIGLVLFWVQLAVNFFWSILFFNLRAYLFSFVWLILLWILVAAMLIAFFKTERLAGMLQIPYLLWLSFAAYLSFAVYILNP